MPCGADVTAVGRGYDAWIETAEAITPFRTFVDARADRLYELPLVRAGHVVVDTLPSTAMVELWHMEPQDWEGGRQRSFYRLVGKASEVMMPDGRVLGIFRDPDGHPTAVSRPIEIAAGQAVRLPEAESGDKSALVVVLERPAGTLPAEDEALAIDREEREKPDLLLSTADHMVAAWYSLPPGRVSVSLRSRTMLLEPLGATISGKSPVVIRAIARRLPSLEVLVSVPSDLLQPPEMSLRVSHPELGILRTVGVPGTGSVRIEELPAGNLEVELLIDGWRIPKQVDLSSGIDAFVTFEPRPITVSGVVSYAGDPADAEVAFSAGRLFTTRTVEGGRYSILLWRQGRYAVVVRLTGHPAIPPFHEMIRVAESRTFDIEIPAACHSVRVSDQVTGRPIPGAIVRYDNDFDDPVEKNRRVMNSVKADDEGFTRLPALRPGSLQLWIEAQGYNLRERTVHVAKECTDEAIDVALEPVGDTVAVHLVLPNGAAASGTELLAIASDETIVYTVTADADGIARTPLRARGSLLLVRHPAAGSSARLLETSDGHDLRWQLSAPGPPLRVIAEDASGRPVRNVALFVWIDGIRIGGTALSFASWAGGSSTGVDGRWVGTRLPAAPTRLLAVRTSGGVLPAIEAYESRTEAVPYPWPLWLKLRAH